MAACDVCGLTVPDDAVEMSLDARRRSRVASPSARRANAVTSPSSFGQRREIVGERWPEPEPDGLSVVGRPRGE